MLNAIGFVVAVAVVSAIIFALMTRADNVRLNRGRSRGDSGYDGDVTSASDSWSLANSVAYYSIVDSSNATDSGACTSGSFDIGGGGDCGGGGGGSGD